MIPGVPYDAEVEWIESTGTQYIDTGMKLSSTGFGYDVGVTFESANNTVVFGGRTLTNATEKDSLTLFGLTASFRFDYFGTMTSGPARSTNVMYSVSCRNDVTSVNGNNITTSWIGGRESGATVYVFGGHRTTIPGGLEFSEPIKLHYLRFYQNYTLIRDFIPVRFTNEQGVSEGAMYDRVTHKLFRNAGTGTFVIGPDVATPVMSLHFMRKPNEGAITAKNYIQNGLVAMWDGIENAGWSVHNPNATTWQSLVSLDRLILNPQWSHEWTDNSFYVKAANGAYYYGACYLNYRLFNDRFIAEKASIPFAEMAVNVSQSNNKLMLVNGNSDGGSVGTQNNLLMTFNNATQVRTSKIINKGVWAVSGTSLTNKLVTFSAAPDDAYINAQHCSATTIQDGWTNVTNSRFMLFGGYNNLAYCQTGHIHSIRIYSRVLTANEIAHNYDIDKARFNLP